jgi:hypothetical protein
MVSNNSASLLVRYSWVLLFVIWALHLVLSARDFFPGLQDVCFCLPGGETPIVSSTGMTWTGLASSDPRLAGFLASTLFDDGVSGVGLAIFGMLVSATSYRKGEKWAWYASWTMPAGILAAQLNIYQLTGSETVLVLAVIFTAVSLLALFLPFRQFFPKPIHK